MDLDDICIQNVTKQKLLGVYIDANLNQRTIGPVSLT